MTHIMTIVISVVFGTTSLVYAAAEHPAQKPRQLPADMPHLPEVVVYEQENFMGKWLRTNLSYPNLANLNNKVSSIIVVSGTWRFCQEYEFRQCKEFGPGYYERVLTRTDTGLDTISSFEPVAKDLSSRTAPVRAVTAIVRDGGHL